MVRQKERKEGSQRRARCTVLQYNVPICVIKGSKNRIGISEIYSTAKYENNTLYTALGKINADARLPLSSIHLTRVIT